MNSFIASDWKLNSYVLVIARTVQPHEDHGLIVEVLFRQYFAIVVNNYVYWVFI
jgi:hypothetical protein